jgi:hypothetical protein
MHLILMIMSLVIAVLAVTTVLVGIHLSHKKIIQSIRSVMEEASHATDAKDGATMTELMPAEPGMPNGTIYMTRAGSVYHTDPKCDQGGNYAPMCAKRECLICKARRGGQRIT